MHSGKDDITAGEKDGVFGWNIASGQYKTTDDVNADAKDVHTDAGDKVSRAKRPKCKKPTVGLINTLINWQGTLNMFKNLIYKTAVCV